MRWVVPGAVCVLIIGFFAWSARPGWLGMRMISCGYAWAMLALLALWEACHRPAQRGRWLAAASLAYGLSIGARPTALSGAVILLVPVAQAWREGRRIWLPLLAATVPITCIGMGVMLYNTLRFGNAFEFGTHYQLSSIRMPAQHFWSSYYLGFNSWVYFLGPVCWGARFPFVLDIKLPPLPAGIWRLCSLPKPPPRCRPAFPPTGELKRPSETFTADR